MATATCQKQQMLLYLRISIAFIAYCNVLYVGNSSCVAKQILLCLLCQFGKRINNLMVFDIEIMRRRRRNVSRKPNIATISEWRSQEEQEYDPDGDTFVVVSRYFCFV